MREKKCPSCGDQYLGTQEAPWREHFNCGTFIYKSGRVAHGVPCIKTRLAVVGKDRDEYRTRYENSQSQAARRGSRIDRLNAELANNRLLMVAASEMLLEFDRVYGGASLPLISKLIVAGGGDADKSQSPK